MLDLNGLSSQEVKDQVAAGKVNVAPGRAGRSAWDIVRANIFTWFNLILGVLFVLMVTLGSWRDALFGIVIVVVAWFVLGLGWRAGERAWPVPGKAPPWVKSIRRRLPRG